MCYKNIISISSIFYFLSFFSRYKNNWTISQNLSNKTTIPNNRKQSTRDILKDKSNTWIPDIIRRKIKTMLTTRKYINWYVTFF